jgi:CRISPR-associated protein Cmr5
MSIQRVNNWIGFAKEALEELEIAKDGKIVKTFRGQISSFGAAISMGNLKSAVAFFSEQAGASVPREKLIRAIWFVIKRSEGATIEEINKSHIKTNSIFEFVCKNDSTALKKDFLDASVALKLAMNLFELV